MVQLGVKYLPTIIGLFNSLTGGEAGSGIGGSGGGGAGGLLDLAANFLGGVTGNTKVETSAGVDPVKAQAATTNNVDRIDPTDLVKVSKVYLPSVYLSFFDCHFINSIDNFIFPFLDFRMIHFQCQT